MEMRQKEVSKGKLRVALLLGARGTGLSDLLDRRQKERKSYEIVGALTTAHNCQATPVLQNRGIPWKRHSILDFCRRRSALVQDLDARCEFDRKSLDLLANFRPAVIVLYGYLYIVTQVLLEAYPSRIINLHDSDLSLAGPTGRPKYRGLHAVRDAILAGETVTRSTVHLATNEVDCGPILAQSKDYPIQLELVRQAREKGALHILKAYAYAQREWMIGDSWGPLLDQTLEALGQEKARVARRGILTDPLAEGSWPSVAQRLRVREWVAS
jgi:phosphoribosylglycinamide formyltransferase-1